MFTVRIGSFNLGVTQAMLENKDYPRVLRNIENIVIACVQDGALDIMCFCELGGHREGFQACRPPIHPTEMKIFSTPPHPCVSVNNNYLAAWGFVADTSQFGGQNVTDCCRTFYLTSDICQPEMVVHRLRNNSGATLVLANYKL